MCIFLGSSLWVYINLFLYLLALCDFFYKLRYRRLFSLFITTLRVLATEHFFLKMLPNLFHQSLILEHLGHSQSCTTHYKLYL